jgi:hypothetical protein
VATAAPDVASTKHMIAAMWAHSLSLPRIALLAIRFRLNARLLLSEGCRSNQPAPSRDR